MALKNGSSSIAETSFSPCAPASRMSISLLVEGSGGGGAAAVMAASR